jgi:hypothetical protein
MELKINELDELIYDDDFENYNEQIDSSFEQIPENTVPITVIKKGTIPLKANKKNVHFDDSILSSQKPMHQSIPRSNAKITRSQVPPEKPKISYEDILSKMGMLVSNGKLHLVDRNSTPLHLQQQMSKQMNKNTAPEQYEERHYDKQYRPQVKQQEYRQEQVPQNSYIFNKYFKDELKPEETIRRPRTLQEYKIMLLQDHLQRQRIKQIKSTFKQSIFNNINSSINE